MAPRSGLPDEPREPNWVYSTEDWMVWPRELLSDPIAPRSSAVRLAYCAIELLPP